MIKIQKFYFLVMYLRMFLKGLMAAFLTLSHGLLTSRRNRISTQNGSLIWIEPAPKPMAMRYVTLVADPDPDTRLVSFDTVPDPAN